MEMGVSSITISRLCFRGKEIIRHLFRRVKNLIFFFTFAYIFFCRLQYRVVAV